MYMWRIYTLYMCIDARHQTQNHAPGNGHSHVW